MQLIDKRLVYSATDLVAFLECRHLANLEQAVALGHLKRPCRDDPVLDRMARRGREYEERFLASLRAEHLQIKEIRPPDTVSPPGAVESEHAVQATPLGKADLAAPRRQARRDSALRLLIDTLPEAPVPTSSVAADLVGRSLRATTQAMDQLVRAGILVQITVGRRNRAFEAPERIEAFTAFERGLASPEGDTAIAHPLRPVPQRPNRARSPRPLRARPTASALTNAAWIRCVLGGLTPLGIGRRAVGVSALAGAVGED